MMKRFLSAALAVLIALAAFALYVPASLAQGEARYAKKKIYLFAKKSASSKKLCQIAKGGEMTLIEASGSWANVTYEDDGGTEYTGYVKKANISKERPETEVTPTPEVTPDPQATPTPTPDPDVTPTPSPSPSFSPVRPGGGGRPSGSGGSGNSSGEQSITDILGITPGKALTSGHASGSYTSLNYGAVGLKVSPDPMTELRVGSSAIDITLTDLGQPVQFTAKFYSDGEREILALSPEYYAAGLLWHMGGGALATLSKSGVDMLVLGLNGDSAACLSTSGLFSGVGYDAVRASGVPESGIGLELDSNGRANALIGGEKRELADYDDRVFYARGLTIADAQSVKSALETDNAEG